MFQYGQASAPAAKRYVGLEETEEQVKLHPDNEVSRGTIIAMKSSMRLALPSEESSQLPLWRAPSNHVGGVENISEVFRRLYYHLYSNSEATRADRIISDLSFLLLLKLAAEKAGREDRLRDFLDHGNDLSEVFPLVREYFPDQEKKHLSIGMQATRAALREILPIDLSHSPAHVLGEAFQALIGPKIRGERGQFFTPRSLVRAMVEIVSPLPTESVVDPACGTGGFLAESHAFQSKSETPTGHLVGSEKDAELADLASTLLRIATSERGRTVWRDSLDLSGWKSESTLGLFDVVLTNPPFGARIGVTQKPILRQYDFGHVWKLDIAGSWERTSALAASQDPQVLFVELCVRLLRPGGRMGIVLPEGLFGNRSQGYIWKWLQENGQVTALLDCPRTTFQPGTDTKTNVLFFKKFSLPHPTLAELRNIRIGVALNCGHDRRGRTHHPDGRPYPDDFQVLGIDYGKKKGRWFVAKTINANYLVPRYYSAEEPATEEERDLVHGAAIITIGELIASRIVSVRKGHEVGAEVYGTGEVPFVRTSDLSNYEIRTDPTKSVSEDVYEQYRGQQNLKPGNVLMVVDGRYRIGTTAILTERTCKCIVQSHIRILGIVNLGALDPYELLFALNLPSVRLRIRDLVFVQSTLGTLGKRLLELRIPLLHGPGPWADRVTRFRDALKTRDKLLSELAPLGTTEVEL